MHFRGKNIHFSKNVHFPKNVRLCLERFKKERMWNENGFENNLHLFGLQMKMGQNENGTANIVGPMVKSLHLKCVMKSEVQFVCKDFFQNCPLLNVGRG